MEEAVIRYPVVLDNNSATWDAYDNRYWPARYLIDAGGFIRYQHFGEASPVIVEVVNITCADFDFVLDELNADGFKLDIEPSERARLRYLQRDESRAEKA